MFNLLFCRVFKICFCIFKRFYCINDVVFFFINFIVFLVNICFFCKWIEYNVVFNFCFLMYCEVFFELLFLDVRLLLFCLFLCGLLFKLGGLYLLLILVGL